VSTVDSVNIVNQVKCTGCPLCQQHRMSIL